jgi:hypothetical protein
MTIKLTQNLFLKGTREFELEGDIVNVRIKRLFKEERLTVGLSTVNPEPVVNNTYLEFHSRAKPEPVLSLFLNKPNAEQFNTFVDLLKRRALAQSNAIAGVEADSRPAGLAANIYEEPPEFKEFGHNRFKNKEHNIDAMRIDETIQLLERYMDNEEIKPLLAALQALKTDPQNDSYFAQMENAFNDLGITQGAVLTYAPYLSILLADDPFGNQ